jgi:hypothetical protein
MRLSDYPRKVKVDDSSNIYSVYYDPSTRDMAIKFVEGKNGEWYHYPDVPPTMFAALISEDSVGKAFHRMFKRNDAQPFRKVSR